MTKKKAIKIIMAATGGGDRRYANYLFEIMRKQMKKHPKANPSNGNVAYRTLHFVAWMAQTGNMDPVIGAKAGLHCILLKHKYGEAIEKF